jgi:hypothetical protein
MSGDEAARPDAPSGASDRYLARSALWDWHDAGRIDILALDGKVIATLDPWQTAVFHGAGGTITESQYLAWLRGLYRDPAEIPADLAETVAKSRAELVELRVVEISDRPRALPYYFDLPKEEQDPEEARQAMRRDGLIAGD